VRESEDGEDDEGDHHRRDRRIEHVPDVGEQRYLIDRGGHHRRIRQGRDLVAEVGAGDDGAGNHPVGESFGLADAQQGHADGGDGSPRTAGHDRDDGADNAGREEEHLGVDELHTVVDEGGDDAAHGPGARYAADEEKDEGRAGDVAEILFDSGLEVLPGRLECKGGDEDGHPGRGEQGHLTGSEDGVGAENADVHGQQCHEDEDRDEGEEGLRKGMLHRCPFYTGAKIRKFAYL